MKKNVSVVWVCSRRNILISGKIIKEMPGSVASGTPSITKLVYVSKVLQQPPIPGAWMQKHTCLGRHTHRHVSAKLSLKLSELNKYRNSFTIFSVKSVNLYFRKIRSDILRLLFAYSQKVGQSEFYTRSAGIRQHLSHNLIHCFKGKRRRGDKGTRGTNKSKKWAKNEEKLFHVGFQGAIFHQ